jgi:hypothetical protein
MKFQSNKGKRTSDKQRENQAKGTKENGRAAIALPFIRVYLMLSAVVL